MGRITITNVVDGQIDGQTYRIGTSEKRTISKGRRYIVDMTNDWQALFADLTAGSGLRIFVVINKGANDVALRHGTAGVYERIVIPAGASYIYTYGETPGGVLQNQFIALYGPAGTKCEVAVFY